MKLEQSDLDVVDHSKGILKGGFHYGKCRKPVVYLPPRPLINHGPHRCKCGTSVFCLPGEEANRQHGRLL